MYKVLYRLSLTLILFFSGCSKETHKNFVVTNPCNNVNYPSWIYEEYVGTARTTASGNKTEQKNLAIKRALSTLLITKGNASGEGNISSSKVFLKNNKNDDIKTSYEENSVYEITFSNINYLIKVINIWEDPCTKELYVQIKDVK